MPNLETLVKQFSVRPVRQPLSGGFNCACWNQPRSLTYDERREIYRVLVEVSTVAFGADMFPYWRDRAKDGYLDKITNFFFVTDADGEVVGWTGYHRLDVHGTICLFLDSTGILPKLQKTRLMTLVFGRALAKEMLRNMLRPVYLAMRTENPVVYYAFFKIVGMGNIYPNLVKEASATVQRIGTFIAGWLNQGNKFEPSSMRIRGAYDNLDALYGEQPVCDDERINAYFQRSLRPEDAFIVIAKMSSLGSARLLARGLARKISPAHLYRKGPVRINER